MSPDQPPLQPDAFESAEQFRDRLLDAGLWATMTVMIEQRDAAIEARARADERARVIDECAQLSKRYLPGTYIKQNMQAVAAVRAYRDGIRALATERGEEKS